MLSYILVNDLDFYKKDSRYRDLQIYRNENMEYIHELPVSLILQQKESYIYYKVDISCVDRLDYVAYKVYKNSRLWWTIALANNIDDPFDIPLGTVLKVPSISSLYGFGGVLT